MEAIVRPSLVLRLRTRMHWSRLTHDIATGTDPASNDEVALRAAALIRQNEIESVATGLESIIASAHRPPTALTPQVPFQRAAVREAQFALEGLVLALRETTRPHPCGVAMAEELLTRYDSPLYEDVGPHRLRDAADAAAIALGQRH